MREFRNYSTDVDTLEQAWVFVMEHVDLFRKANIHIESIQPEDGDEMFGVAVYGVIR